MPVRQALASGLVIRQDFRDTVRFVFFDIGQDDWQYARGERDPASFDAAFSALDADEGRPSIAPERRLRAARVEILFSIRSERQWMEQFEYNLLFRCFVGLSIDEPVWVPTELTKSRDRLLDADMSQKLMRANLAHGQVAPLLSDEHFSVDGTLVEACGEQGTQTRTQLLGGRFSPACAGNSTDRAAYGHFKR